MPVARGDHEDSAPMLLSPRRTSILDEAPALAWRAVKGATHYRVKMSVTNGAELWSREVPASAETKLSLSYPTDAPKLAPETDYTWEVEALDEKGGLQKESTAIHVLSTSNRGDVQANLAKIRDGVGGPDSPAARFLAGSYLSGLQLYQDAAEQFHALAALSPKSPDPHKALGYLYKSIGLVDLAANEFQQALALGDAP
jgi:tetratricopeptide (TPR) repeat protein